ncbi:MAG: tetratricopeptide repeat protein [Proteobacteria bacterium]|nr:tetratricopeptide repeat protein [Pseudomonadota bacterium]
MKDATKSLRRLEIRSVAPAVGRFAALANTFPRPTAFEGVLAFKAVTRFNFVNALWFWFHCWFSHNHTLAYGRVFVNHLLTIISNLLLLTGYAKFRARLGTLGIFHHIKQYLAFVSLAVFLSAAPAAGADMASGLAAVKKGDYETALKEWLPLAEDGNPSAQYNIGQLYRLGRGVPKDYTKASQWYEKAAEMRHSGARHNLAVLYEKGLGVPIDYAKALDWYEKAANQDYGIAQFNLAVMYSVGQGTKRDLVKAYTWYAIAADRDIDGAAENSDQIAKLMTEDQLKEALERAREWIDWRK